MGVGGWGLRFSVLVFLVDDGQALVMAVEKRVASVERWGGAALAVGVIVNSAS